MAATARSASDVMAQGTQGGRRSIRSRLSIVQSFLSMCNVDRDSLAIDCGEIMNGGSTSLLLDSLGEWA